MVHKACGKAVKYRAKLELLPDNANPDPHFSDEAVRIEPPSSTFYVTWESPE